MTKKTSKKIQEKLYLQYLFGNVMMDEGQQCNRNAPSRSVQELRQCPIISLNFIDILCVLKKFFSFSFQGGFSWQVPSS